MYILYRYVYLYINEHTFMLYIHIYIHTQYQCIYYIAMYIHI